jgi:Fe2+ or Zn2+ uptake regulation protein
MTTSKVHHPLVETFVDRLEERGHRVTGARGEVARQPGHFTVEAMCHELPGVGRATVYRNIKLMVDMGLVCRVLLEDGSLHYQVSHRSHHHHLICTKCGRSQDLLGCDIDDVLREKATAAGFGMEGHWLDIYGRCRECSEKSD